MTLLIILLWLMLLNNNKKPSIDRESYRKGFEAGKNLRAYKLPDGIFQSQFVKNKTGEGDGK